MYIYIFFNTAVAHPLVAQALTPVGGQWATFNKSGGSDGAKVSRCRWRGRGQRATEAESGANAFYLPLTVAHALDGLNETQY